MKQHTIETAASQLRHEFMAWYQQKFGSMLPIYVRSEQKKELKRQFESETHKHYSL